MSSIKYATPLILEPRPSRGLLSLIIFFHAGVIPGVLLLSAWPWPLRLLLIAAVLISLWASVGALGWRHSSARIQRVIWQSENVWRLALCSGEWLDAELKPSSFMHPWLVVLNLRVEGRRWPRSLVLARDSLDETTFRQLRVRLTTEAGSLFGEV